MEQAINTPPTRMVACGPLTRGELHACQGSLFEFKRRSNVAHLYISLYPRVQVIPPEDGLGGESISREWSLGPKDIRFGWSWTLRVYNYIIYTH